jgi:hypothetical protein
MTDSDNHSSADRDQLCIVAADLDVLRAAVQEACDLLAERKYGNPARSPGHNARLVLERGLKMAPTATLNGLAQAPLSEAERHAIAHARYQVEHASPDNPDPF